MKQFIASHKRKFLFKKVVDATAETVFKITGPYQCNETGSKGTNVYCFLIRSQLPICGLKA